MKRIVLFVLFCFTLALNTAMAGVAATEPAIPSDLATNWQSVGDGACTPREGITLSQENYAQPAEKEWKVFAINKKNGETVAVAEVLLTPETGNITGSVTLKTENGWMKYDVKDPAAEAEILKVYGVTKEEYVKSCR